MLKNNLAFRIDTINVVVYSYMIPTQLEHFGGMSNGDQEGEIIDVL